MQFAILILLFISVSAKAFNPIEYIEGEWRGSYESKKGETFTIEDGLLSLSHWDCSNNKISVESVIELDQPPKYHHDKEGEFYEITLKIHYNSESKGCPNNPNIFKYYEFAPNYQSPLIIVISKDPCKRYDHTKMSWKGFSGRYYRLNRDVQLPRECKNA